MIKKSLTFLIMFFACLIFTVGCSDDELNKYLEFEHLEFIEPETPTETVEPETPTEEQAEEKIIITKEIVMTTQNTNLNLKDFVTFQIIENEMTETAYVKVVLEESKIPEEAIGAEFAKLIIDGQVVAEFTHGKFDTVYTPKVWGECLPEIAFYTVDDEGEGEPVDVEIFRATGDLMPIEPRTWFLSSRQEINFPHRLFPANGNTDEIFCVATSVSDMSMLFLYAVRIPAGETLTIGKNVSFEAVPHVGDFIGHPLRAIHYRGEEYRNRFDLYENPDAPCYNINPEPEKWIDGPIVLSAGVHVLYVAPSEEHDQTRVEVTSEDSRGNVFKHVMHTRSADWGWLFPESGE